MGCILKGGGGLYSRVVVGAVLLAAGEGRRMGGKPKSLLELGGVSLIRRQLIALSGAGVDELVVVLGHYADDIEPQVREFPVTIVRNPDPSAGQISSLRCGLAALTGKLDAVMIALADQPLIHAQDISDLIGAYKKRPESTQVVYPEYEGQRGNPVIISADVKEAILKDGRTSLRSKSVLATNWSGPARGKRPLHESTHARSAHPLVHADGGAPVPPSRRHQPPVGARL